MERIKKPIPNCVYDETLYAMSAKEVEIVLPLVKREYNHALKMVEHYKDLTMDGYGTDRQTTALMKWESKAETLERMLNEMDDNTL